jgi:cysteinyl-tRNA synthetase
MSTTYLGDAFDIHGGGVDLVFPHHENELAQAREAGKPFARYWVHNGLLTVNGEKMSKSLGNYITVDDALKTHYRVPIDYSLERMDEAQRNGKEFAAFFEKYAQVKDSLLMQAEAQAWQAEVEAGLERFEAAMDDDLNTPKALGVLFDLVNLGLVSVAQRQYRARLVHDALHTCKAVLGLRLEGDASVDAALRERIESLIRERDAARQTKNFQRADEIRRTLEQEGVILSDTAGKTLWYRK